MLVIENLTGGWGPTTIVEDFSLTVSPGEVVAMVGRNGVGKSTTLELIVGRARRLAGRISVAGRALEELPIYERSRGGLGYVPQAREVFPSLTVHENLLLAARPGEWSPERIYELFPPLARRRRSFGAQLSGGEQQMLSIGRALIGNPSVLLMDEPTEGLAPIVVEQMIESIARLSSQSAIAIVLVEQMIDVALYLASRCLVMDRGRIVHAADSETLRGDSGLMQKLMGFDEGVGSEEPTPRRAE